MGSPPTLRGRKRMDAPQELERMGLSITIAMEKLRQR